MLIRRLCACWMVLGLLSMGLVGCGGGSIQEGSPPEDVGYVEPLDAAEPPGS